ncbi:hypothetical protein [Streptodolium elevatio]|uniref:Uncharacterized protein n=1 Tax=Streptodolium elevatio TaxID=3157996 RepID=A0ABV3DN30_9ACTN
MPIRRRTRDMTIRVYTVHPDGTTTELIPLHVAARSELTYLRGELADAVRIDNPAGRTLRAN